MKYRNIYAPLEEMGSARFQRATSGISPEGTGGKACIATRCRELQSSRLHSPDITSRP
jgi:hypothetical protein